MDLQEFVREGWTDHADHADAVFERLPDALELVGSEGDVAPLAALMAHVCGEHLGRWTDGVDLLARLRSLPAVAAGSDAAKAPWRLAASLLLCAGDEAACREAAENARSERWSGASDEIRVLAVAASALAGQDRTDEAIELFEKAERLAGYGPTAEDPAARALAVTGNNLACELEEKPARSPRENDLLRRAARCARTYWEIAGTWDHVQRAEYRLARALLALNEPEAALAHARACRSICEDEDADPVSMLVAHEALALALFAVGDRDGAERARRAAREDLESVDDEAREWCAGEVAKLDQALGVTGR